MRAGLNRISGMGPTRIDFVRGSKKGTLQGKDNHRIKFQIRRQLRSEPALSEETTDTVVRMQEYEHISQGILETSDEWSCWSGGYGPGYARRSGPGCADAGHRHEHS